MSERVTKVIPATDILRTAEAPSGEVSLRSSIKVSANGATSLTPEERQRLIAEMAYYLAEHRGFGPDHDVDDWLEAESQVDSLWADGTGRTVAEATCHPL